jgi:endonuclease YncB( thermonuclease family)
MSGRGASSPKRRGGAFVTFAVALAVALGGAAGPAARVLEVIDGDTLRLDDGRTVRLAAIQAPKPGPGRYPALDGLAARAGETLARLTADQAVTLETGSRPTDRYGRTVALVRDAAGRLLQSELLRHGLARVGDGADQRAVLAELYAAEAEARAARHGVWALHLFRIRRADELARERDGFQIVEATVRAVEPRGRAVVIALGTADAGLMLHVEPAVLRLFQRSGRVPDALVGRIVRVRGWVTHRGTPTIEIAYPEQIELP